MEAILIVYETNIGIFVEFFVCGNVVELGLKWKAGC